MNRALCLMWTEVRWRAPGSDAERAVIDEALRALRKAFPLDPSLPYPWREWHELLGLRDLDDPIRESVLQLLGPDAVANRDRPGGITALLSERV